MHAAEALVKEAIQKGHLRGRRAHVAEAQDRVADLDDLGDLGGGEPAVLGVDLESAKNEDERAHERDAALEVEGALEAQSEREIRRAGMRLEEGIDGNRLLVESRARPDRSATCAHATWLRQSSSTST